MNRWRLGLSIRNQMHFSWRVPAFPLRQHASGDHHVLRAHADQRTAEQIGGHYITIRCSRFANSTQIQGQNEVALADQFFKRSALCCVQVFPFAMKVEIPRALWRLWYEQQPRECDARFRVNREFFDSIIVAFNCSLTRYTASRQILQVPNSGSVIGSSMPSRKRRIQRIMASRCSFG